MLFIIYLPLFFLFLCAWCSVAAKLRGFSSWFKRRKVSRGTYLPPYSPDTEEYLVKYLGEKK